MEVAKVNVEQNGLDDRITLFLNKDPLRIFVLDPSIKTYDFCMCNPPFYATEEEVQEGLENKELEPMAVRNRGIERGGGWITHEKSKFTS